MSSKIYPVDAEDPGIFTTYNGAAAGKLFSWDFFTEAVNTAPYSLVGGTLRDPLVTYSLRPEEATSAYSLAAAALKLVLRSYDNWPVESVSGTYSLSAADLKTVLISYGNWPAESTQSTYSIQGGTLT